jgi:hypothetical protein
VSRRLLLSINRTVLFRTSGYRTFSMIPMWRGPVENSPVTSDIEQAFARNHDRESDWNGHP